MRLPPACAACPLVRAAAWLYVVKSSALERTRPPLSHAVFEILERLGPGWRQYLGSAGLGLSDATKQDFAARLKARIHINFDLPGLEDFSRAACRGIEPGDPARSLLYHVLASPGVIPEGVPDDLYPLPHEIEIVENFVFGIVPPSAEDLRMRAEGGSLAIVVFAYEYAPAIDTVHRRHADICFSRAGIARIGRLPPRYVQKARGYLPNHESDDTLVHVVPCRYGAFIAAQRKGNPATIGPERFQDGDEKRDFWIPLHKLFDGPECIDGLNINLKLTAHHVNEKIRRIHWALSGFPRHGGHVHLPAEYDSAPFVITQGLADFEDDGHLLVPFPHEKMIEFAKRADGTYVTFRMPPHFAHFCQATFWIQDQREARRAPEFVHARYALQDGEPVYLGDRKDKTLNDIVNEGGYEAVNLVDYTADGWVEARCDALAPEIAIRLSAYSIVGPPDFFPLVKQQDIQDWWETACPPAIRENLWPDQDVAPRPLSGSRLAPNLTLTGAQFDSADQTYTAIVGLDRSATPACRIRPTPALRSSTLSYRGTNLFEPGWDCSQDYHFDADTGRYRGPMYLANYGLSSPFAEDTLICAAEGATWPGAVPDISRSFGPLPYPSVTPIFDSALGWDGLPPPYKSKGKFVFQRFAYADYVRTVLAGKFRFGRFASLQLQEYLAITLSMSRVFQVMNVTTTVGRAAWVVLSFKPVGGKSWQIMARKLGAEAASAPAFEVKLMLPAKEEDVPGRFDLVQVAAKKIRRFIAGPAFALQWNGKTRDWDAAEF